jgi:hypothetical protein
VGTSDDDSADVSLYDRFLSMAGTTYACLDLREALKSDMLLA